VRRGHCRPVGFRGCRLRRLHCGLCCRGAKFIAECAFGNQTITPQLAYSVESDYESIGASLTHAIDLNQKNTTLSFGVAYTYDEIAPEFWNGDKEFKNSADVLIGLSQLLGPKTIFTANFTYGTSHGYLSDPYKRFRFSGYPLESVTFPEKRPDFREKQIGFMSLTHSVTPLNGSAYPKANILSAGFRWRF